MTEQAPNTIDRERMATALSDSQGIFLEILSNFTHYKLANILGVDDQDGLVTGPNPVHLIALLESMATAEMAFRTLRFAEWTDDELAVIRDVAASPASNIGSAAVLWSEPMRDLWQAVLDAVDKELGTRNRPPLELLRGEGS